MEETEKLWSEYGKLQAQREQLQGALTVTVNRLREIFAKIKEAEKKKPVKEDK